MKCTDADMSQTCNPATDQSYPGYIPNVRKVGDNGRVDLSRQLQIECDAGVVDVIHFSAWYCRADFLERGLSEVFVG